MPATPLPLAHSPTESVCKSVYKFKFAANICCLNLSNWEIVFGFSLNLSNFQMKYFLKPIAAMPNLSILFELYIDIETVNL